MGRRRRARRRAVYLSDCSATALRLSWWRQTLSTMHIFLCTVSAQTSLMTPSSRRRNRARSSSHLRTNRTEKYRGVAHGAVLGLCAEGESSTLVEL